MSNEFILNFTPTGMIPTKDMTPHVPISVSEIVEDVHQASEIGITMVHLHARDETTGVPTYKKEIYAQIVEGIRKYAPELVICLSLSGRNFSEIEFRSDPLLLEGDLKPDMGSLTLSSLNFNKTASVNSPDTVMALASIMKEKGIIPELEAFDIGMINYAKYLEKKKLIEPPYYFNLLFGNIACSQANLLHSGVMINDLPQDSLWSLAGIGNEQLKMNSLSLAFGGGVRVGIEDNIWYDSKRTILAKNSELLKRIHVIADANERTLMSPKDFRVKMNLAKGFGEYGRAFQSN
ncbi:MAG: 3-keto-5-aminohexanoate cleavage protein [Bacteroidota bacterium]|uniref:3-keto-5-aminohexanoate cleavage protein n=1 Tax=Flagellimonas profundi TaxID=2915620 RepID=A0ABS3FBM1_9FLAO|nr:3-keto-5-aminohexanoate cleavage protein [Allomuricauda profundi]MBO0340551.1 3-keto-5-aminohexanoate cleavage protein [Allomuricauda profundi]MEC7770148.1 3-keto-5-aminohexanoate cleavage protein [Bacteroidota bacterium]